MSLPYLLPMFLLTKLPPLQLSSSNCAINWNLQAYPTFLRAAAGLYFCLAVQKPAVLRRRLAPPAFAAPESAAAKFVRPQQERVELCVRQGIAVCVPEKPNSSNSPRAIGIFELLGIQQFKSGRNALPV